MNKVYIFPPKASDFKNVEIYLSKVRNDSSHVDDYDVLLELKKASDMAVFFLLAPLLMMVDIENIYLLLVVLLINWPLGIYLALFGKRINKIYELFISNHHKNFKEIKS